jgi:glycosyltransferase involved in cell wall biosynthesis
MTPAPLHIVQAAAFPFPSRQGSQVYVGGMAKALAQRGHRITLACYGFGEGEVDPGIDLRTVPVPKNYRNLRAGPDWVKPFLDLRLANLLCKLAPEADLIHAHNYEAPLAAYVARRLHGTPVIYNNHNTMGEELHRYFEHPAVRSVARWAGRGLDLSIPKRADACVAISQAAKPILESLGCANVHPIPPGIDLSDLQGASRQRGRAAAQLDDRIWVVYAGNPDEYQDLEVLVDAVLRDESLGLLMVSASPMPVWEARADALPDCRKRFVQTDSWAHTKDLIVAADIAALPRAVCSGYPIKLLNYLGLGVPTVCAEGSARPLAGILSVPNGDVFAFQMALRTLAEERSRRLALGAAGAEFVSAHCTWDARAHDLEILYAQVLTEKSTRRHRSLAFRRQNVPA